MRGGSCAGNRRRRMCATYLRHAGLRNPRTRASGQWRSCIHANCAIGGFSPTGLLSSARDWTSRMVPGRASVTSVSSAVFHPWHSRPVPRTGLPAWFLDGHASVASVSSAVFHPWHSRPVPRTGLTPPCSVGPGLAVKWIKPHAAARHSGFFVRFLAQAALGSAAHEKALPLRDRASSSSAQDWTRTSTAFRPHAPQACVSTNFTTWARGRKYRSVRQWARAILSRGAIRTGPRLSRPSWNTRRMRVC